ncbi:MAG: hypothetical protein DMG85_12660 [Acidobacteria bacterium]|nr:MAG: hypothetical protein DMG85_12660 [Acidobacteriota bacterium]
MNENAARWILRALLPTSRLHRHLYLKTQETDAMESYIAVAKHSGRASWRLALLLLVIALFLIPIHMLAEEPHHRIQNIIVICQENWSFDSLYGLFPGANGVFGAFDRVAHTARPSHR